MRVSGSTELAVMLLDVLCGIDELKVAVAYECDGKRITELPSSLADFERCRPVYETLPGLAGDITKVTSWADLPEAARRVCSSSSAERWACRSAIVSVGPERRQTIMIE